MKLREGPMGPMVPENPKDPSSATAPRQWWTRTMPAREIHISPSYWMPLFLGPHLGLVVTLQLLAYLGMGILLHYTFFQQVVEEIMIFSSKFSVPQWFLFDPWTGLGLISLFWDFEHYLQLFVGDYVLVLVLVIFSRPGCKSPPAAEDFYGKEGHQVGPLFQVGQHWGYDGTIS